MRAFYQPGERLEFFYDLGFDQSSEAGPTVRVRCSQCEALVINDTPCHETGCPNAVHECRGCNALIPVKQRYCSDCSC